MSAQQQASLALQRPAALTLSVAHLWGGEPLSEPHALLGLSLTSSQLNLEVSARWMRDPAPPGPPGALWGLWEREVVELFVVGAEGRYLELELSPYGHHLALSLEGVRRPARWCLPLSPHVERSRSHLSWRAFVTLPRAYLPEPLIEPLMSTTAPLYGLNAFACWGPTEQRAYALHTPLEGERPDFHQPERFLRYPLRSLSALL